MILIGCSSIGSVTSRRDKGFTSPRGNMCFTGWDIIVGLVWESGGGWEQTSMGACIDPS